MESQNSQSKEQLLQVAEALFSERGYTAVTLKDIAQALGVRQAALYYHVPEGKEQLFVEVTKRSFLRHRRGLDAAIAGAEPDVAAQLTAMANWLLSQPPLDMTRLARSDLPALSEAHAQAIYELGLSSLEEPVRRVINEASQRGEIRQVNSQLVVTIFLSITDAIHDMHRYKKIPKEVLAQEMIDVLLDGMRPH